MICSSILSSVLHIWTIQKKKIKYQLFIYTEKATNEKNVNEKWGIIMDICDRIGTSSAGAKESLKIIIKRLNHGDPHVIMQAITVKLSKVCFYQIICFNIISFSYWMLVSTTVARTFIWRLPVETLKPNIKSL